MRTRGGRVACGPSGWSPWSVGQWRLWRGHRSGSTSGITAGEGTKRRTPAREGWGSSCGSEVAEHVHATAGSILHGVVMLQVARPLIPVEVTDGALGPALHQAGALDLILGELAERVPLALVSLLEGRDGWDRAGALGHVCAGAHPGAQGGPLLFSHLLEDLAPL